MNIVGMISGTSADGVDAVVIEVTGAPPGLQWRLLSHVNRPHPQDLREDIFACFRPETADVVRLCRLNFGLGRVFAGAALDAIAAAGLRTGEVDLIGSHGQTVWHIPDGPDASTLQIGEAAVIAEMTGITTVSNFRTRDMAAGGQGAPLVSYVDTLLLGHPERVRAAQNIGGIANVTYLPPYGGAAGADAAGGVGAFAFDTGPGNMLMDYAAARVTGGEWRFDRDGALGAKGRPDFDLVDELLLHPYFALLPPKTTGRELFGVQMGAEIWDRAVARGLSGEDIVATLTAFTARSIAQAYRRFLPRFPEEAIVSGGGAANPTLMTMLAAEVAPARVLSSAECGLPIEAKEAVAFAVMAYETAHGRPGNLPAATGASGPVILGDITPGHGTGTGRAFDLSAAMQVARPVDAPAQHGAPYPLLTPDQATPVTEARNPASEAIDSLPTLEVVRLINAEDAGVAAAVARELPAVAEAVDGIAARMRTGGRLVYIGAGTSGRLGVLDAAECPPTFGTHPQRVVALIAGGPRAITQAVEGAEDDRAAGARDIAELAVGAEDSVVGIAASGRTPYVIGGMQEARRRGALVISLACARPSPMAELADIAIAPVVGPEVISGSTRLKAGTAQKMVLNLLSTGTMIRLGKTFGNLMVDVQATNAKLRARAQRIVSEACDLPPGEAARLLEACDGEVKVAIVSALAGLTPAEARERLQRSGGVVREALRGAAGGEA